MQFKIPFSGRGQKYTDKEIATVVEAMKNGETLTQGKYRDEFEKKFSQTMGTEYSYAVSNATAAFEIAAQLCLFEKGDEIIVPSHTFTSSVYPFIKKGAKVIWADIDLKTRVVSAETISRCITDKTKAIIVVHLYGYVAEMALILELARANDIIVIEDAAQSIGADINGKMSGSFGDFGIYSFHSHKNISTLGEGGMLCVKDHKYAKLIPMLRHNGHCPFEFKQKEYWMPAMGNVDLPSLDGITLFPNNYCIGEVECALGSILLDRLECINKEKRLRAIEFIDTFKEYENIVEFHRVDSTRHNYHLLVARMKNGRRDEFIKKMSEEKKIKCVVQYYPLNRYDFYKKLGFSHAETPNADLFFDNMVSFPFQHWMSNEDFDYMKKSTLEILKSI